MTAEKNYKGNSFFLRGQKNVGILLFHGWTSPPDELLPLGKYLNSFGFTVYAPLLRGHGTEPEDLKGVTWKDWLSDAREALEKLKKYSSEIFVGGVSMGGDLAYLVSDDRSVVGILSFGTPIRIPFQKLANASLLVMGLTKTYRQKYIPPWERKKRGERPAYPFYPVKNAREVLRLSRQTEKFLPKITKPVLIIQAESDHMVSKRTPEVIERKIKSKTKEVVWIKNAYHVFINKKEVHKKITDFIGRILKSKRQGGARA